MQPPDQTAFPFSHYWVGSGEIQASLNQIMERFYGMDGGIGSAAWTTPANVLRGMFHRHRTFYPYSPADTIYIVTCRFLDEVK